MRERDYRCTSAWPSAPYPLPCIRGIGHAGPHQHVEGGRYWTDEEAQALDARARDAAEDAWHRAYNAVVLGQEAGVVAVGLNRAERRRGLVARGR